MVTPFTTSGCRQRRRKGFAGLVGLGRERRDGPYGDGLFPAESETFQVVEEAVAVRCRGRLEPSRPGQLPRAAGRWRALRGGWPAGAGASLAPRLLGCEEFGWWLTRGAAGSGRWRWTARGCLRLLRARGGAQCDQHHSKLVQSSFNFVVISPCRFLAYITRSLKDHPKRMFSPTRAASPSSPLPTPTVITGQPVPEGRPIRRPGPL